MLICYDVEFPENVRALALAGADLVLVPTALMAPYDFVAAPWCRRGPTRTRCSSPTPTAAAARASSTISATAASSAPTARDLARAGAARS